MDIEQYKKSKHKSDIKEIVLTMESFRKNKAIDINLAEMVHDKWGMSMEAFYNELGIDPNIDTIQNIFTLPDDGVRFLVPEIIRDALRLGLRKGPIWPNIIAAEERIPQLSVTIPHVNMSEASPKFVGQAETIQTGTISFGQKTLKVRKIGKGIKIPDEVKNYVSLNVVSVFLQDFGVKLGQAIDTLMIDVLVNGEQANGSESSPVIGINTPGTLTYVDILRLWIRMNRIGRSPSAIIGGEASAINTWELAEFKQKRQGTPDKDFNLKTPVPSGTNYYIHGRVSSNQQIFIDPSATIIKYNAQPLLVETERIVSNQTEATYATLTTGFGIVFRDGRVILDKSLDFATNGFPSFMNVDALEQVTIE